jgi:hypothetical protein
VDHREQRKKNGGKGKSTRKTWWPNSQKIG